MFGHSNTGSSNKLEQKQSNSSQFEMKQHGSNNAISNPVSCTYSESIAQQQQRVQQSNTSKQLSPQCVTQQQQISQQSMTPAMQTQHVQQTQQTAMVPVGTVTSPAMSVSQVQRMGVNTQPLQRPARKRNPKKKKQELPYWYTDGFAKDFKWNSYEAQCVQAFHLRFNSTDITISVSYTHLTLPTTPYV